VRCVCDCHGGRHAPRTEDRIHAWRENDIERRKSTLDGLLRHQHKVRRGGAIGAKPNEERRKFVKKWVAFEGEREDAAEEAGIFNGDWLDNRPVPERLTLGGLQIFTPLA
jgi:hypothetical protein